jgi:hypothetical protein
MSEQHAEGQPEPVTATEDSGTASADTTETVDLGPDTVVLEQPTAPEPTTTGDDHPGGIAGTDFSSGGYGQGPTGP